MAKNFYKWGARLLDFRYSVKKDLQEIRKCKAEMQQMRNEMAEMINSGRYIRDDQRLILSAPEIIIGNVDPMGVLYNDANSKIVLRGTDVGLQAAGEYGQVEVRATSIREVAEDPGVDGFEHVVDEKSEIVSQARNIVIQSNDEVEAFSKSAKPDWNSGVYILSDSNLYIRALNGLETKKRNVLEMQKDLTRRKEQLENMVKVHDNSFENLHGEIRMLVYEKAKCLKEKDNVRLNYNKLDWLNAQLDATMKSLAEEANSYGNILSELAETNRHIRVMEQRSSELAKDDDFRDNYASTAIYLTSENVNINIEDGDHKPCHKKFTGIDMYANNVNLNANQNEGKFSVYAKDIKLATSVNKDHKLDENKKDKWTIENEGNVKIQSKNIILESVDYEKVEEIYTDKQLTPGGRIKLRSKTIDLSTMNAANMEKDENGKITKANYTAEGDIIVRSKTLAVVSTDYDIENGEVKEKSLTKDSQLFIRTEKTDLSATETDGKATGRVCVNAKDVILKSMDVDKDSHSDVDIAENGSMVLYSENVILSAEETVSAKGNDIGLFATRTFEVHQGDNNSVLQLSSGNVEVGANMTQVYGDTEVRGELKTPKATIDNLEVKASLKSPNISDGMAAPVPSAGNLDTKLDEDEYEDIREEKSNQQIDYESSCLNPANWDF